MFQTAFTLTLTQFARTLTLPERLQRSPVRNLTLEALRQRNTALDALFYDVKVITPEEAFYISGSLAAEGSIMIVPPSGGAKLTLCETLEEFVVRGGQEARALAAAGIGGSALGAAAFARNVANAIGAPVAVVVSGYGLADIITEAFGGHFFFGHLKGLRPIFEILDDLAGRPQFGVADENGGEIAARSSLNTRTVRALLADPRLSFRLLAGHSKGNLVISAALHDLCEEDEARAAQLAETVKIITVGTRIAMPPTFSDVVDVIGEWDWFGEMNSRPFIPADQRIPHAWHHTNTDLNGHLPVTSVLKQILATAATSEKPETAPALHVVAKPEASAAATTETVVPSPTEPPMRRPATIKKVKEAFSNGTLPDVPPMQADFSGETQPPKPH
ncbi:hypothetical protein [Rhizobium jaguaris]|uniref:Cell envelope biogenesis protein OmpA n=1 Tax=Rhizobium jaguaris TaxID=1312183 RepID=A0A387FVA6_9HYPH|nr:hypothetical protein [Rhizobium jaguaris]AYG59791.1 hypothetical protein CCGE525_13975 [Rhizobium jaguaris]